MNILAVTACLKRCSVAILHEGKLYEVDQITSASANLVQLANSLVTSSKIDMKNIDGVITASGPGSFTGIRVAQSFAKSIALSLGIPSVSIDYFEVIDSVYTQKSADQQKNQQESKIIVIKTQKNHVYFRKNSEIGIDSYENIAQSLTDTDVVIGDAVHEISAYISSGKCTFEHIDDFCNAKHLLHFSYRLAADSVVCPLYINASN